MSSSRYSETRTFQPETRLGSSGYNASTSSRQSVPIQYSTDTDNEQRMQERIRQKDTTVEWVSNPTSGAEKFRVTINIDGFHQNEVTMRVDGNKLVVYGEHIENHSQSTSKKIIEKSYDLPRDIDKYGPQVTYPTPITMQIDFPSHHSNVLIDDGRLSTKLTTDFDRSYRTPPRLSEERSSSEYTSTRKIGGGSSGVTNIGERSSNPFIYPSYNGLFDNGNTGRSNIYTSTNDYRLRDTQSPTRRGSGDTKFASSNSTNNLTSTFRVRGDDIPPPRTIVIPNLTGSNGTTVEKTFSETHTETHRRRSSPTTGVQSSHEVEHHRSGSPSIARNLDENRFRTTLNIGDHSITQPRSSHNVEVREYSRRIGTDANNNANNFSISPSSLFTQGFNSDIFYRSAFNPKVFTDDRGQNCIEMTLDVQNYEPNDINVSVNGTDLIVKAEHNVEQPPTSSTRAYFYKRITLPPNADFKSIASEYRSNGTLHITAKLFNEKGSIKYN